MKSLFLFLLVFLMLISSAFGQKGAITFGFNWEAISKGGFTLGYFFTDRFSIEAHFGGVPHIFTWGLSGKFKPFKEHNKLYIISGISKIIGFSYIRPDSLGNKYFESGSTLGINFGIGHESLIKKSKWRFLFEFGLFKGYPQKMKRIIIKENEADQVIDLPLEKKLASSGFLGFGFIRYSKK